VTNPRTVFIVTGLYIAALGMAALAIHFTVPPLN